MRVKEDGFINTIREISLSRSIKLMKLFFTKANFPHLYAGKVPFIKGLIEKEFKAVTKAQKLIKANLNEKHSITGHYVCVHGDKQSFKDKNTAIIAHFDSEHIIDPYVEYICKELKNMGFKVILTSTQPIKNNEVLERWQDWADAILYVTCAGRSFTAWKAALDCFPSVYESRELLLTDDSYYGPFTSFQPMHDTMSKITCDFWGIAYSEHIVPHLKKDYLMFKSNILQDKSFQHFIDAIPLSNNKEISQNLELSLGIYLTMHGFQAGAFAQSPHKLINLINNHREYCREYFDYGTHILPKKYICRDSVFLFFLNLSKTRSYQNCFDIAHKHILRLGSLPNTQTSYAYQFCIGHALKNYKNFPASILPLYEKIDFQQNISLTEQKQPSIAVALHCFYPDALDTIFPYLKHLPSQIHIYVTTDTEEKKHYIQQKLQDFTFVEVRICPNAGWDMAPFFIGLRDVLLKYELILKLHVKKSTHLDADLAHAWREVLYGSLMGNAKLVSNILHSFGVNSKLGVIAPVSYPPFALPLQKGNKKCISNILQKKDIVLPPDAVIDFPVGGMFWCRSQALRPWLDLNLKYEDFKSTNAMHRDGTLAHALERLIFWGCGIEGMTWTKSNICD